MIFLTNILKIIRKKIIAISTNGTTYGSTIEKKRETNFASSETIQHEESAHALNELKGVNKTEAEEHNDYFGNYGKYTPTLKDVLTDPKYKGTPPMYNSVKQIEEILNQKYSDDDENEE